MLFREGVGVSGGRLLVGSDGLRRRGLASITLCFTSPRLQSSPICWTRRYGSAEGSGARREAPSGDA